MAEPDTTRPLCIAPDRPRRPWWDYAVLAAMAALPVLAGIAEAPVALTAALCAPGLLALQWCVSRRGGWRLIGPHSYYDLIRMSRKGRTNVLRVAFLVALLGGIWYTFQQRQPGGFRFGTDLDARELVNEGWPAGRVAVTPAELRDELARFNMECVYIWLLLQNITILLLTPAYVGGAIAEERERGTLDMLLATGLYSREIALGKLLARLVHLGAFLIAGLPVFSIMLVWGGIDLWLLLAGWINSVLLLVAASSVCLMFSTMPVRPSTAVLVCYAVVLPGGVCWIGFSYAALQSLVLGGGPGSWDVLIVLAMMYAVAIGFCLPVAIVAVRPPELPPDPAAAAPWNPWVGPTAPATDQAKQRLPSLSPIVARTATEMGLDLARKPRLPPIGHNALLWKERHTGGRSLLLMPEVLVLAVMPAMMVVPLICTGVAAIIENSDRTLGGELHALSNATSQILQGLYALCLVCYGIGVAYRAAVCVVRERQMHTLDMLLQLPVERREILCAKCLGVLVKGWPWLMLLAGNLAIGLLIGVYHPVSCLFLLVAPAPWILALCGVGLFISTIVRTTMQANLAIGCTLLAMAVYAGSAESRIIDSCSGLVCTWWQSPSIPMRDAAALGGTAAALLLVAGLARYLAGVIFERR